MVAATHAHRDLNIDLDAQVDVFEAIHHAGLLLAFEPFPRLSGAYIAETDGQSGVVINASHPLSRQRFTAAHELAHHRLGHGSRVDPEIEPLHRWGGRQPNDDEMVAESFAAWFLMPRPLVRSELARLGYERPTSPEEVYQLSLRLGTSYEATARHLPNLRLADSAQVDDWVRVQPARIKTGLAAVRPLANLRRDVFAVDDDEDGRTLFARPGDRLTVRLAEVPSSGFTWRLLETPPGSVVIGDLYEPEDEDPDEAAGARARHIFELDLGDDPGGVGLVKDRPWSSSAPVDSFVAQIKVSAPRRGVDERYFRTRA